MTTATHGGRDNCSDEERSSAAAYPTATTVGQKNTRWRADRLPDGTLDWTDPTGHHHLVAPATYPIDHTLDDQTADRVVPNDNDRPDAGDSGTEGNRAA